MKGWCFEKGVLYMYEGEELRNFLSSVLKRVSQVRVPLTLHR